MVGETKKQHDRLMVGEYFDTGRSDESQSDGVQADGEIGCPTDSARSKSVTFTRNFRSVSHSLESKKKIDSRGIIGTARVAEYAYGLVATAGAG